MDDETGLTIDELTALTKVPTRRIRFYQTKGVLPQPERRGRVAYYRDIHVQRLRLIGELQDRGLRLSAIRDLVNDGEPTDPSVREWLGFGEGIGSPWSDDQPTMLSETEISERLGDRAPGTRAALQRAGLVTPAGDGMRRSWVVHSPALLDLALQLDAAGIDVEVSAQAGLILSENLKKSATTLVKLFFEQMSEEPTEEAAAKLEALRPASDQAVRVLFAMEIERALRDHLEREAKRRAKSQRDSKKK